MAAWEISFKIRYDYPLIKMSEMYKGSKYQCGVFGIEK